MKLFDKEEYNIDPDDAHNGSIALILLLVLFAITALLGGFVWVAYKMFT